mgnify:CR=1 FL=1|jgi:hypothetical protein
MINKKIVICAVIKNEAKNIKNFFYLIKKISNFFLDYHVIIVESDSTDETYKITGNIMKNFKGKLIKTKTNINWPRTKKISHCRNIYLKLISSNKKIHKFDYVLVIDADNVNNQLHLKSLITTLKDLPKNWIGVFPNQKFIYYDLYALRIKKLFDFDCFEKMISSLNLLSPNQSYFKNIFKNYFILNKFKKRFIKVESAFGGLGIYKLKYVLNKRYSSLNGKYCEHVFFNKSLYKKNNFLYIDKKFFNSYGLNEHFFKGIIYSLSSYFSKKLVNSLKFNYVDKEN